MAAQRSSPVRAWLVYSALRLVFFGVPLALIWDFSGNLAVSAVFAAVIGLCLSLVLLDRQRGAVAVRVERLAARRRPSSDESVEDRVVGGPAAGAPADGAQSSEIAAARPKP